MTMLGAEAAAVR